MKFVPPSNIFPRLHPVNTLQKFPLHRATRFTLAALFLSRLGSHIRNNSSVQKLRGGSQSPLTQLKRLVLSDSKALAGIWSWRNELITGTVIRQRIQAQFGIELKHDSQVSQFWGWLSSLILERGQFDGLTWNEALELDRRSRQVRWILRQVLELKTL